MRKSIWLLLSLLLVSSLVLAACGGGAAPEEPGRRTCCAAEPAAEEPAAEEPAMEEKQVLNVWSFTNEIRTMAIAFEGRHPERGCCLHHDPDDRW